MPRSARSAPRAARFRGFRRAGDLSKPRQVRGYVRAWTGSPRTACRPGAMAGLFVVRHRGNHRTAQEPRHRRPRRHVDHLFPVVGPATTRVTSTARTCCRSLTIRGELAWPASTTGPQPHPSCRSRGMYSPSAAWRWRRRRQWPSARTVAPKSSACRIGVAVIGPGNAALEPHTPRNALLLDLRQTESRVVWAAAPQRTARAAGPILSAQKFGYLDRPPISARALADDRAVGQAVLILIACQRASADRARRVVRRRQARAVRKAAGSVARTRRKGWSLPAGARGASSADGGDAAILRFRARPAARLKAGAGRRNAWRRCRPHR